MRGPVSPIGCGANLSIAESQLASNKGPNRHRQSAALSL